MSIRKVIVASASVVGLVLGAPAWSKEESAVKGGQCEPRIVSAQTLFPKDAQHRGHSGTVRVQVVLDKEGRVTHSQVTQSSGSKALDRAAQTSVNNDWRFEVSHCIAAALPVTQEVNVVYKRVPTTFSASVNRRGIEYAKRAAENDQCAVVSSERTSESVISCINRATPGGIAASGLANR